MRQSVHIQVNLKSRSFFMKPLSIGEVAKRTGVRTSALRYYEEAGILPAPARVSGRRRYDADTIHRIDVLRFAQQAGFTLEEIKTLFHGFGAETPLSTRWRSLAHAKLRELDLHAKRIRRMRRALELGLKCGCIRIEDCTLSPADVQDGNGRRVKARCDGSC
jgi:MerR family transcriptional regulator, redox-sensitive transcriptional activator SoxR